MNINLPLSKEKISKLKSGQMIYLNGKIYTARDAAHKRIVEDISSAGFEITNSTIFYTGPSPKKDNQEIGSCGPTTSYRMDRYTKELIPMGHIASIGKGERSEYIVNECRKGNHCYLVALGGLGALYSDSVKSSKVISYNDLGTEAVRELIVEDFPVLVAYDKYNNIFEDR